MTVCVIYGSPHKGGNTARMLKEYVSGLGLKPDDDIRETECYSLSASPCTDCGSCGKTGRCFMSDMDKLYADVEKCDLLLIVGTSLQVYPAAGLYRYAGTDTPIYIIDPKDVPVHDKRIVHIKDVATAGMKKFLCILEENKDITGRAK